MSFAEQSVDVSRDDLFAKMQRPSHCL